MGCYRAYTRDHLGQNQAFFRDLQRSGIFLVRNTRIFIGDGSVIENGSVLVRDGKIAEIYQGSGPDPDSIHAETVEGAGKTLLPGLVDVHVHLGGPAGVSSSQADYDPNTTMPHAAAALLYSGITAARGVGDGLDLSRSLKAQIAQGSKLGAQLFICGPYVHRRRRPRHRVSPAASPNPCATPPRPSSSARPRRPTKPAARCASSKPPASTASRPSSKPDGATACSTTASTS